MVEVAIRSDLKAKRRYLEDLQGGAACEEFPFFFVQLSMFSCL